MNAADLDLMIELASDCIRGGNPARGAEACAKVLRVDPEHAGALRVLGVALLAMGQAGQAIAVLSRATAKDPRNPQAHFLLGEAMSQAGEVAAALDCLNEAIRLAPNHGPALSALAGIHRRNLGDMPGAAAYLRQAMAAQPEADAHHSSLLMTMHYSLDWSPDEIAAEHRAFGARFAAALSVAPGHLLGRKLRVGYVSADFRAHPVARFMEAPLRHHDRQTHEIFCYVDVDRSDATTGLLAGLADHWRDIAALSDAQVADLVRRDQIDVLVDLTGHSGKNRLRAFARRLAPVQVTYLGYPDTTGVPNMDYRLVDDLTDPVGVADGRHTEQLVRLPGCFLCYTPEAEAPPVAPPPCVARGTVTFGSFNNFAKISPQWVALAARVLRAVPGSRILLKSPYARSNDGGRRLLLDRFIACDIAPERVVWLPADADPRTHLERYGEVDIALDTFPYHGTTTTCEALWMGVPVVSLSGETHASRVGASLLAAAGLGELVAANEDDFVRIAAELARDAGRLEKLRSGMRGRLTGLMDGVAFTRKLERAYANM